MPKIFSEDDKKQLREKMLKEGLRLLETKSCREISVDEVAASAGIAKGTFYHFFTSKESYFYEIMMMIRDRNRVGMLNLFQNLEPSKELVRDYLYYRYTNLKTVYDYFSLEEIKAIQEKISKDDQEDDSVVLAERLFSLSKGNHREVHAPVVINLLNIAAVAAANRNLLEEGYYQETIFVLADAVAGYVFDNKPVSSSMEKMNLEYLEAAMSKNPEKQRLNDL